MKDYQVVMEGVESMVKTNSKRGRPNGRTLNVDGNENRGNAQTGNHQNSKKTKYFRG